MPPFRLAGSPLLDKVEIAPVAGLLATAIQRLASGEALTDLLVF